MKRYSVNARAGNGKQLYSLQWPKPKVYNSADSMAHHGFTCFKQVKYFTESQVTWRNTPGNLALSKILV